MAAIQSPRPKVCAAVNYNDMMRTMAGSTGLTRKQADEAIVTTLTVLAEVISAGETRDLLAQLPKSIRDRVPVSGTTLPMRPIEFVARVADLAPNQTEVGTEAKIRAVFAVLTQAVNSGEMNDIADELGDEFADLLDRTERLEREEAHELLEQSNDQLRRETDAAQSRAPQLAEPMRTTPIPNSPVSSSAGGSVRSLVGFVLSAPIALAHVAYEVVRRPVQSGIDLVTASHR